MTITTPIEIIQKLIAIHTTRIEMVEKWSERGLSQGANKSLQSARLQSEKYSSELMTELSKFGDAVPASVDNQNEYQVMYKSVLKKIDSMTPQEAEKTFQSLEAVLKKFYQSIVKGRTDLPTSLQETLNKQDNHIR